MMDRAWWRAGPAPAVRSDCVRQRAAVLRSKGERRRDGEVGGCTVNCPGRAASPDNGVDLEHHSVWKDSKARPLGVRLPLDGREVRETVVAPGYIWAP
ncbi:hypothetical protein NDU88_003209 [Pleurodeles waltl]|uniref:Uncharacterized protein n=1 Tax=Pleurodeles waltl TaxID=8319 RepID=A0AAV7T4P4_PLEWA|nr:hypothetical protein NDU88_003209 [Pleurodeles waltl]